MRMDGKCEYRQKCWQVQVAVSIYAYRFNVQGCILTQQKNMHTRCFPSNMHTQTLKMNHGYNNHTWNTYISTYTSISLYRCNIFLTKATLSDVLAGRRVTRPNPASLNQEKTSSGIVLDFTKFQHFKKSSLSIFAALRAAVMLQ